MQFAAVDGGRDMVSRPHEAHWTCVPCQRPFVMTYCAALHGATVDAAWYSLHRSIMPSCKRPLLVKHTPENECAMDKDTIVAGFGV